MNTNTSNKNIIKGLEDKIELNGTTFVGDRGYASLELMLNVIDLGSYFVIRMKSTTFKNERKNLTGGDETISVNMNSKRLQNVDDPEIKEKFLKEGRVDLRIIRIPLEKNNDENSADDGEETEEFLVTNLTKEMVPYEDFKDLCHKRWNVEIEFDRLKNLHEIENFSGRKEISIKQDFNAKILLL